MSYIAYMDIYPEPLFFTNTLMCTKIHLKPTRCIIGMSILCFYLAMTISPRLFIFHVY